MAVIASRVTGEKTDEHGLPAISIALCILTLFVLICFIIFRCRKWSANEGPDAAPYVLAPADQAAVVVLPLRERRAHPTNPVLPVSALDEVPVIKYGARQAQLDKFAVWHADRSDDEEDDDDDDENGGTNPASRKAAKSEPPPKSQAKDLDLDLESACCAVCTDGFGADDDVRVLPCRHTFHQACIDPWLLNKAATCPICRIDLCRMLKVAPAMTTPDNHAAADYYDAQHPQPIEIASWPPGIVLPRRAPRPAVAVAADFQEAAMAVPERPRPVHLQL
ncbi:hypothetical protein B0T26DRAFT_745149 [Lasiosphaeria miniovina]|uniref:RING-type domain-containing protein n=1 Tax=Lasiosphaeria miniovina TaxID=1954250 RepID=A0AA40E988_9PEZI|nr:uncharacterized protein B0T26DRAFT_745149 [Lasiosphaeria miniovina]KAK0733054.1 hypothetical protein B0T26DRAFT_745149 [Lasiosphaeria miniovina]